MLIHHTFLKFQFWNSESGNYWSKWIVDFEALREFSYISFYHKNLTNFVKVANVKVVMADSQLTRI